MKILFLTHYFPPEVNAPANRTFEHCRQWVKEPDVDVTVITNFPNHPDGKIFPGYKNKLFQKEKIDGIEVIRVLTFISANEGFLLRTTNYVFFMVMSILYVLFSRIKFDIMVATSPQFFCGLAGKYIAKLKRKPFILEIRDLWPESIVTVGAITSQRIIDFLEGVERRLYHSADHIVSVTRSFVEHIHKCGIPREKISIIFNGISADIFSNKSDISDKNLKATLQKDKLKLGYIGTIGMAHSIITLVNAAEKLKEEDVQFLVVGSGAERKNIEAEIANREMNNFHVFPIQPKSEIPSIINGLDVFIVNLKKSDLFKTVIPSKIFEGMIMKKPILIGVDGEARAIVEEAEAGLYFEPENAADLVQKIQYLSNNPAERKRLGENGYKYVINKFNRKNLAAEMLSEIKKISDC